MPKKRKKPRITVNQFVKTSGSYTKLTKLAERNTKHYGWKNTQRKLVKAHNKI